MPQICVCVCVTQVELTVFVTSSWILVWNSCQGSEHQLKHEHMMVEGPWSSATQDWKYSFRGPKFLLLFLQVFAEDDDYLHLSVFEALPCDGGIELKGVEQHKTKGDPLEPFTNWST